MDCKRFKVSLQGMIDNALDKKERMALRGHLDVCPACRKEYRLFKKLAAGLGRMPFYEPGPAFNRVIFQRLGLEYKPYRLSIWLSWSIAGGLSLLVSWMVALALVLPMVLIGAKSYKLAQWANHPDMLLPALQSAALKAGMALYQTIGTVVKISGLLLRSSAFPVQLALATLVAYAIIIMALRRTRPQSIV